MYLEVSAIQLSSKPNTKVHLSKQVQFRRINDAFYREYTYRRKSRLYDRYIRHDYPMENTHTKMQYYKP